MAKIEKNLRKVVPQLIDLVVTPFLTLTVTIFLMLFILGPITHQMEVYVSDFILMLIEAPLGIGDDVAAGRLARLVHGVR